MRVVNAIGNTVLLKISTDETQTKSGIVLNHKSSTPIYEIVSMGDIAKEQNLFNIGDKVVIRNTVGTDVYVDTAIVYKSVRWWEIDGVLSE